MAGETPPLALTLTELSMRIEEMGGGRFDGRRSLVVLKEALGCCHRSGNLEEEIQTPPLRRNG
ncbi:hypothetical protein OsJ_10900 [Oryza sativa Japonica Group]|uniref:Uncharacterized protein n=2 Tax=Oryza sativa subsp. japonica TaxID=39947 RepID=A0A8J8XWM9_ORYSJ|nr:hypothetical protein LOC_Os03g24230 [Oryza sativa Japonica Group]EAZ26973.1 hypothetical protein OsJ_10900 [Oryza sativa Japonica Group]